MSEQIKDAFVAMDCARKALEKANITFYTITSARKENNVWLVKASAIITSYVIRIDANTGDVLELASEPFKVIFRE